MPLGRFLTPRDTTSRLLHVLRLSLRPARSAKAGGRNLGSRRKSRHLSLSSPRVEQGLCAIVQEGGGAVRETNPRSSRIAAPSIRRSPPRTGESGWRGNPSAGEAAGRNRGVPRSSAHTGKRTNVRAFYGGGAFDRARRNVALADANSANQKRRGPASLGSLGSA